MKNKKFKEKIERVLKKNIEFEKKIKSESDKISESENKSDDDISELEDLFVVISTFFFRSYELISSSFRFYELFFSFFQSHELFFSFRSYELKLF